MTTMLSGYEEEATSLSLSQSAYAWAEQGLENMAA